MSSPTSELPNLGRYQVVDRIAAGGMAEVFLARAVGAMGFQRLVAVKLIHSNFTRDPEFVKMFIDEARIAMHLHHRNIVQVFDLDEVGGTYFLAMEYVKGVNLYDLYERIAAHDRWVEVPLALYLVAEVCKGLHFAHTRAGIDGRPLGIIHRDISPQNVLLSFEGEVKITDFGIATAAERLHQTAAGIVKGKYAYMAPERLQEMPCDARVDVFSAGVLLYELLVGENPFAGPSAVETIEAVLGTDVPAPSSRGAPCPKRLDEICLRALAKDPKLRYPSAQALADDLTELAMGLTYARKDMASGDAAVSQLLAELFPAERARPVGDNRRVALPGLGTPVETNPDDTARRVEVSSIDDDEPDDLDAPTLLRPSPMSPRAGGAPTSEARTARGRGSSGDDTSPTELPGFDSTVQMSPVSMPLDEDEDDPYASTVPAGTAETAEMSAVSVTRDPSGPVAMPPVSRPPVPLASAPSPSAAPVPHATSGAIAHDPAETHRQLGSPWPPAAASSDLELVRRAGRRGVPRWATAAILALAVIASAGAAVVLFRGGAEQVVEVPVSLDSRPPGARVFVNGRELSERTPLRATMLAGAPVDVRFELEGHQLAIERVVPDARRATSLTVTLEPKAEPPPLSADPVTREVTLRPKFGRWAHVYRNGEDLGPTPVTVELPVGTVTLEVAPEGKRRRRSIEVEVPPRGPAEIALEL